MAEITGGVDSADDIGYKVLNSFGIPVAVDVNNSTTMTSTPLSALGVSITALPHMDIHNQDAQSVLAAAVFQSIPNQKIVEVGCNRHGEDIAEFYVVGDEPLDESKIRYKTPGVLYNLRCGMVIATGYKPPAKFYFRQTINPILGDQNGSPLFALTAEDVSCYDTTPVPFLPSSGSWGTDYSECASNANRGEFSLGPRNCYWILGVKDNQGAVLNWDEYKQYGSGKAAAFHLGPYERFVGYSCYLDIPKDENGYNAVSVSFKNNLIIANDKTGATLGYNYSNNYKLQRIENVLVYGVPVHRLVYIANPALDTGNGKPPPLSDTSVRLSIIKQVWNQDQIVQPNQWASSDWTFAETDVCKFYSLTQGQEYDIDPRDPFNIVLFNRPGHWDVPQYWDDQERDILPCAPGGPDDGLMSWPESAVVKSGQGIVPASRFGILCNNHMSSCSDYSIYINYSYNQTCMEVHCPTGNVDQWARKIIFQATPMVIMDIPATIYATKPDKLVINPLCGEAFEGGFIDQTLDVAYQDNPTLVQDFQCTPRSLMQDAMDGSTIQIDMPFISCGTNPPDYKPSGDDFLLQTSAEFVKSMLSGVVPGMAVVLAPDSEVKLGQSYAGGIVTDINYAFQDSGSYLITATIGPVWGNGHGLGESTWSRRTTTIKRPGVVIQKHTQPDGLVSSSLSGIPTSTVKYTAVNTNKEGNPTDFPAQHMYTVNVQDIGIMACVNSIKDDIDVGDRVEVEVNNWPVETLGR